MTTGLVPALLAVGITAAVAPAALYGLRRAQVLDYPTERSSHRSPIPRGGGLAPAAGAVVALAVTSAVDGANRLTIVVVATGFGLVGIVEDVVGISALRRLAVQFVVAGATATLVLRDLSGPALWMAAFAACTVIWLVAFVNAYNFMDGIDGISVAQAVGAGGSWFLVGRHLEVEVLAVGSAIVAGAALGFAPYNLPKGRMFLGDVGSYFIGAWLAVLAVLGLRAGVPPEAVFGPLVLYGADTGATLLRRLGRREQWYEPHRDHAYQRLTGDGRWSHIQTSAFVFACICVCGALGAVSLGSSMLARIAADIALVLVVAGYLVLPRWLTQRTSRVAMA